jgi:uncharacterized protein DUF5372
LGFLVIVHPFHPLCGRRLPVLFSKKRAGGVVFVCEDEAAGRASVTVPSGWTDRGPEPAGHRLSVQGLGALDTLIAAIVDLRDRESDHLV